MQSFHDAQRIVLSGYPYDRVRHYCLTIESASSARTFFAACAAEVLRADQKLGTSAVTLGLTQPGLQALQFPSEYFDAFSQLANGFFQGAAARAAEHLADTGRNESPRWEAPFRDNQTHAVLSIYADDEAAIAARERSIRALSSSRSVTWNRTLDALHRGTDKSDRREWFGFRDGISQPRIIGWRPKEAGHYDDQLDVAPGEFLLGHANDDGENVWADPTLPANVRDFVANGSFGAIRKMQQHIERFDEVTDAKLKAKICGRWPSGALVREEHDKDPGADTAALNAFDFRHDPQGRGCPFGSHIRRMNPRSDPSVIRTPALMRRGIPYQTGQERGMLGVFLCASLERQFEFLLRDWGRSPPMNPHYDTLAADPWLAGEPGAIFRDGVSPTPVTVPNLGRFITTRGTLYCFFPSVSALDMMATGL